VEVKTKEYTGWEVWYPTDEQLADFYTNNNTSDELLFVKENEYLIVKDHRNEEILGIYKKKNGKFTHINGAAIKIKNPKDNRMNIVYTPRNTEQKCVFDMLHDPDSTVKLITGTWGTGKTLLLVTAALEALRENRFEKIVWVRNNVDVQDTKDLGALPGDIKEKLMPFLGPFVDHVGGEARALKMIEEGQLEIQPLQFIRGRDIKNAIIMCSEAENLTKQHIKLILSRAAEGTNVWLDGDTEQRDKESFETSQGLEKIIGKLAGNKLFGYVKLVVSERSETAALAELLD